MVGGKPNGDLFREYADSGVYAENLHASLLRDEYSFGNSYQTFDVSNPMVRRPVFLTHISLRGASVMY